jgi:aminopeptidase N
VFANAGAHGYYRTAYSSEVLRALAPRVSSDLSAPERLSLVADEWALVRARRHSVSDYLTLAAGYGREHTSGVLEEASRGLAFVGEYLTPDAAGRRFQAFVGTLLRPLYDELGFSAGADDGDDRRALRATVIRLLGTLAEDPDVVARAKAAASRAIAGSERLDPTAADAIVETAAAHGDAALFDALAAAAERTNNPDEHYRYLYALAGFRDPALIDRGLARALTPQLRTQDTALYLAQFFANAAARPRALAFVTDRWSALAPKVTIFGGDTVLVRAMGSFCDAKSRDDIKQFFTAHPLPAAARTLDQTLERIDSCIALRSGETAAAAAWLAARTP